jgi:hypothetical protein
MGWDAVRVRAARRLMDSRVCFVTLRCHRLRACYSMYARLHACTGCRLQRLHAAAAVLAEQRATALAIKRYLRMSCNKQGRMRKPLTASTATKIASHDSSPACVTYGRDWRARQRTPRERAASPCTLVEIVDRPRCHFVSQPPQHHCPRNVCLSKLFRLRLGTVSCCDAWKQQRALEDDSRALLLHATCMHCSRDKEHQPTEGGKSGTGQRARTLLV